MIGLTVLLKHLNAVGDKASVQAAHKEVVEKLGHPEVLVYNAGPGGFQWPPPSILDTPADKFAKGFDNGVTGALLWIQQVMIIVKEPWQSHGITALRICWNGGNL